MAARACRAALGGQADVINYEYRPTGVPEPGETIATRIALCASFEFHVGWITFLGCLLVAFEPVELWAGRSAVHQIHRVLIAAVGG